MDWAKIAILALSVVRELLRYLREAKKCDGHAQVKELTRLRESIAEATDKGENLNIVV